MTRERYDAELEPLPEADQMDATPDSALINRLLEAGLLRRKRLIVAIDNSPESMAAVGVAVPLARSLGLEVEGLFVEEVDLLRMARLPFITEIRYGQRSPLPLVEKDLRRTLRARADTAREKLEAFAKSHQVRATFRVAPGRPARLLLEAGKDVDLVVMGRSGHRLHQRDLGTTTAVVLDQGRSDVLVASQMADATGEVVAIVHERSARQVLLDVAQVVAGSARGVRLVTLSDTGSGWLDAAVSPVDAASATSPVEDSPPDRELSLRDYLLARRTSFLIVQDDGRPATTERIRQLRSVSSWHLLVLRGGRSE